MSAIDAQGTTFTFDGELVGGLLSYQFMNGVVREVLHRALSNPAAIALPGQPDFGQCVLNLLRDKSDAGQLKMQTSLRDRQTADCVLTYADGSSDEFEAFCLILPLAGSKNDSTPVNASACILRISGPITSP